MLTVLLKGPITPQNFSGHTKSLHCTEQNAAKTLAPGQNRDPLWTFKVMENRIFSKHDQGTELSRWVWVKHSLWRHSRFSNEFASKTGWSILMDTPDKCVVFGSSNTPNKEKRIALHPIPIYRADDPEEKKEKKEVGWLWAIEVCTLEAHKILGCVFQPLPRRLFTHVFCSD